MAKNVINRGSLPNDGTGDNLRLGAEKINNNFSEIYTAIGDGTNISGIVKVADDSSTVTSISANGETLRILGGTAITTTLSGNDLTIAADTSALITSNGVATLTNKTINGPDNTITNIGNSSLSNSSITVSDGSNTSPVSLGGTLTFAGTTNEVDVVENAGTITYGLPNNVTISNNLNVGGNAVVTGDLTVNGTTTTVNSTTIEVTNSFTFEGTTSDDFETTLTVVDPTADRTVSLPNATGTVVLQDTTDTLTNKTINGPDNTITNLSATSITSGAFNLTSEENKIRFNYDGTSNFPTAATYEGMFVFDKSAGQKKPYVASSAGYINLLTENDSIDRLSNVNITGVSNGDGLIFNSAQGRFNVGALPSTGFSIAMAVAL
tara:strand:+ start:493 stop:1629 length:1137 start_codon:yes stop_codon:yes gene_type:complete